jgi:uncharacterized membrane protein YcaP (DUF421 family)
MLNLVFRTTILYFVVNIGMRFMGKRQVGQMSTPEIIVALLISEVAAMPISDKNINIVDGIIGVSILVILEIIVSYLDIKFPFVLKLSEGKPVVIINKGKLNEKALLKTRMSITELNAELRLKNITLKDVFIAIIESNGQLSIIPKNEASGVTREDMKINVSEDPIDFAVIIDGVIKDYNLKLIGKDRAFIDKILSIKKVKDVKDVLILCADKNGLTFFQKKDKAT